MRTTKQMRVKHTGQLSQILKSKVLTTDPRDILQDHGSQLYPTSAIGLLEGGYFPVSRYSFFYLDSRR